MNERRFPLLVIQKDFDNGIPRTIPWALPERAYAEYSRRYRTTEQSLERLAERGGFAPGELDMFVPGWRAELGL
ncbi:MULTISPECIES: hypothetical protein [unclassified Corallococcus]|uniref:hypothetical protein n=1 Tax=unclassified Corallococcus TaxID=2685029 RepID=UPI001A90280F|nr:MULTISPECIES: hypothetical protein [unclassified Corallococcus]MBN9683430.1 hypothetical protein [Corallococcus sp. NCSPR001]WAS85052.1 hypothetical protein O0N60_38085 [Corallococcus sp. NCRR]